MNSKIKRWSRDDYLIRSTQHELSNYLIWKISKSVFYIEINSKCGQILNLFWILFENAAECWGLQAFLSFCKKAFIREIFTSLSLRLWDKRKWYFSSRDYCCYSIYYLSEALQVSQESLLRGTDFLRRFWDALRPLPMTTEFAEKSIKLF